MRCVLLKCFILANASGYGGAERALELLVSYWKNRVELFIFIENEKSYRKMKKLVGKEHVYQFFPGNSLRALVRNIVMLRKIASVIQPDYWISNTNKGAFYLSLLSLCYHIPHSNILVYIRDYQWKFSSFIFYILNNVDVAVPTKATLEYKNKKLKFSPQHVFITNDPVRIPSECNGDRRITNEKYILLLANLSRWKGIYFALQAFYISQLSKRNIKLFIFGNKVDPIYFDECQKYVDEHHLNDNVTLGAFREDTSDLYRNCLMVLNTSLSEYGGPETFGLTIVEAWSYKKPVIAFSEGGPKYLVKDGVDGLLIPERDINRLAESMVKLVDNPDLRNQMGEAGYQKSKNVFDSGKVAKNILDYIEENRVSIQ